MSFLQKIFGQKDISIKSNEEFWDWFIKNEKDFFKIVKEQRDIEKLFFYKLSTKLNELKDGYFYLTGMFDDNTVELVLTADGVIKNIAFVEELVKSAPVIYGWKFTALKPELDIKNVEIRMAGYLFGATKIGFYTNNDSKYPDEIDITIVHDDMKEDNTSDISMGACIFLDNFLGELNFASTIDKIDFAIKTAAKGELIPIEKLKDYLKWRQAEFIEKYEDVRRNIENDNYSALEMQTNEGMPVIAIINQDLLNWESKASHPWILNVSIKYNGRQNNGMPDKETYELLNKIEDQISNTLKDKDGFLNIGRQTAENVREIYFACKDFRKPSKVLFEIKQQYAKMIALDYDIYKDKYWKSFAHFTYVE